MCIKAHFESPKHLHQTTLNLKLPKNKQCFEINYIGENVMKFYKQKVDKIFTISLSY
jgi:hypothetical protein